MRVAAVIALSAASARNPIVPDVGMADPHVHEFNGTFYVYATHDFSSNNTAFLMRDWYVWSSPNLVTWTRVSVLPAAAAPSTSPDECWATDAAHRDGTFFWYLSMGSTVIGVVTSPSPAGPWADPLGVPLVNASVAAALKTEMRHPCAFIDDDGAAYLIAGFLTYQIARLNEDMISFAEPWRALPVVNPTGPNGNGTDDKPFLFTRDGVYYLSWGCFYATSTSVYGPYTYVGSVIDTAAIAPAFRMNDTAGPWFSRDDYKGRHGSFWESAGQWFFATTDWSHSSDVAHRNFFRDSVIGYVHFLPNGSIAPVAIDATGVGEYDGARVEAENFMALEGAARKKHAPARGGGAFVVAVDGPSAALSFPRVHPARARTRAALTLVAANAGAHSVTVRARSGGAAGAALATCVVEPSRGAFAEVACTWSVAAPLDGGDARGIDIYLSFEGEDAPLRLELDAFLLLVG